MDMRNNINNNNEPNLNYLKHKIKLKKKNTNQIKRFDKEA